MKIIKKYFIHFFIVTGIFLFSSMSSAQPLDDATIFAIFDEVNTLDIWTARLAAKKGHSTEVRKLGRKVATDHEGVQQLAREIAKKYQIVPTPPDNDQNAQNHAQIIALLQSKSGTDFDKTYLLHESKFHAAAINAVKTTLLPAIKNKEFKALVNKVAPAFVGHLDATVRLAKKLGYTESN